MKWHRFLLSLVAQRKLSASPVSSPPTPGTTLTKKEKKKKKKKKELEDPEVMDVLEGEAFVRIHCFIRSYLK
jgi:hypothetical protein